jgi:predicted enzyme related to lactoylglutathione lyase
MTLAVEMVTFDCADPARLAEFWAAALETEVAGDYGDFVMLARPAEGSPALSFQRVPDPTPGKNRVHVDLATADRAAEVDRLLGLGATLRHDQLDTVPGFAWSTLADPEGNEFCVSQQTSSSETG